MKTAGYSGTPLSKKLGIKDGNSIQVFNSPKSYLDFFIDFPKNVKIVPENNLESDIDLIHIFSKRKEELINCFTTAKPNLKKS